jgi:hypothetical protein
VLLALMHQSAGTWRSKVLALTLETLLAPDAQSAATDGVKCWDLVPQSAGRDRQGAGTMAVQMRGLTPTPSSESRSPAGAPRSRVRAASGDPFIRVTPGRCPFRAPLGEPSAATLQPGNQSSPLGCGSKPIYEVPG